MKNNKRVVTGLVLALAGTVLWAHLGWAQGRGGGGGCCSANPASPGVCQVQGQGTSTCPVSPAKPDSPQGRRGAKARNMPGSGGPQDRGQSPPGGNPQVNK